MTNITDVNVFPDINMYKFEGFQAPNYDRGFPNQFAMIPVRGLSILLGSSNPVQGEVYSIKHYVIKFVSYLRQVGGFLWVLRFPPPIKQTATIELKYC
jgi:hypothetical protein